ncbi:NAC domain-containing protein 2-like [Aristolochia californica]|uniref:NAC domain-containing protein 2-like n=1 Tax=Aristolochia californica TaxID=171875 RepID=UPI0035E3A922
MEPTFQAEVHREATEEHAAVDDGEENNPDRTVPVGFRFRPTDQELVSNYLFNEALSQPLPANLIREIDEVAIREHHPSKLGRSNEWVDVYFVVAVTDSDEKEMFFFTQMSRNLHEKEEICIGGSAGLWRSNKDEIKIQDLEGRCIGSKRSMSFFQGKPPCISRTRWVMEVYWLNDDELQAANLKNFDFGKSSLDSKFAASLMNKC